jgi:predicted HTH domain antitoxin
MSTITLQVPDVLAEHENDTVRLIAAKLYESGKLTLGQAAEMAGMKKWDFAEILVNYDVNYFQYTAEDILQDARTTA